VVRRVATEGRAEFLAHPADWTGPRDDPQVPCVSSPLTLLELREVRFAAGLRCVRCRSPHVHRWGSFAGRRRYRCTACHRTFSDLTGTPMAYSKLPWLWGEFGTCMMESLTVRAAAARLGVNKDTTWRWRHRVLAAHARIPPPRLAGFVESYAARFPINRKGERDLTAATRADPRRRMPFRDACWILFGRDRSGATRAAMADARPPCWSDYRRLLGGPVASDTLLLGRQGRFGAAARYAAQVGIEYRRVCALGYLSDNGSDDHLRNVLAYALRFRHWLHRFRGVATRYLLRYLSWHLFLDEQRRPATRLLLSAVRAPPARQRRRRSTDRRCVA